MVVAHPFSGDGGRQRMRSSVVVALACVMSLVLPVGAVDQPDDLMPGRVVIIRDGALTRMVGKPAPGDTFELPDATNDPTVSGAKLEVFDDDPNRPLTAVATLPAYLWTALGNPL